MIILVDFDETLCTRYPQKGYRMGEPMPGAVSAMKRLAIGNQLVVFTGRRVDVPQIRKAVSDWLDFFHMPYDNITNMKPEQYDLIIDNKAMHFDRWPVIMARIQQMTWDGKWDDYVHPPTDLGPKQFDLPKTN